MQGNSVFISIDDVKEVQLAHDNNWNFAFPIAAVAAFNFNTLRTNV